MCKRKPSRRYRNIPPRGEGDVFVKCRKWDFYTCTGWEWGLVSTLLPSGKPTYTSATNFPECTDEELVQMAQAGNEDATEYLLQKYQKLVYIWTRPYFLQGAEDDDLLQEGMIGLFKAIRDFTPGSSSFWSFAKLCITRNIISAIKGSTRQKHIPLNSYTSLHQPWGGAPRSVGEVLPAYSHAWAIRDTVARCCGSSRCAPAATGCSSDPDNGRPCLLGYIDKCSAPCVGRVDADEHRAIARTSPTSWAGAPTRSSSASRREMYAASQAQDYERAAMLRDDLGALNKALEKQAVVFGDGTDADVIALAEDPLEVAVQIFHVRAGRIRGQRGWVADRVEDLDTGGLVERVPAAALRRRGGDAIPREILVPAMPEDADDLRAAAGRDRGEPGGDPGAAARRQARPPGDRGPERRPVAGAAQDQARQRPHRPQPGAGGDPGGARARRRRRCGSSATTSPTCRAPRWSARWWSSRTGWPARASTAGSSYAASRARTTSPRCTR